LRSNIIFILPTIFAEHPALVVDRADAAHRRAARRGGRSRISQAAICNVVSRLDLHRAVWLPHGITLFLWALGNGRKAIRRLRGGVPTASSASLSGQRRRCAMEPEFDFWRGLPD
jgi:hypothetical protein